MERGEKITTLFILVSSIVFIFVVSTISLGFAASAYYMSLTNQQNLQLLEKLSQGPQGESGPKGDRGATGDRGDVGPSGKRLISGGCQAERSENCQFCYYQSSWMASETSWICGGWGNPKSINQETISMKNKNPKSRRIVGQNLAMFKKEIEFQLQIQPKTGI